MNGTMSIGLMRTAAMPEVYARHIVCLPPYPEGLPCALIEAAGCARPIVTTDVPGCRGAVEHGDNGFLVPPRAPRALASDPELRIEMGRRGRERAVAGFALITPVLTTGRRAGALETVPAFARYES